MELMAPPVLRGEPDLLVQYLPILEQVERYGKRVDGSQKGPGYFGQVSTEDEPECFTTELPITVPGPIEWQPADSVGGQHGKQGRQLIPLVVPSLTRAELAHLVGGGLPTLHIKHKAIVHACNRLANNKSPFAQLGEQRPLPEE